MSWQDPDPAATEGAELVSTDVFDTLLLRDGRAERARILSAERRFARGLAARGLAVSADMLVEVRLQAQRLAFRALNTGGGPGEVRLADIVSRQLVSLGVPDDMIAELTAERVAIEVEQEMTHLRANTGLMDFLRRQKTAGRRVVAISDTTLSGADLTRLIDHCCGPNLLDRVYSSADEGMSKREGALFTHVARVEGVAPAGMLHIGDDRTADHRVPSGLGLRTYHVPRARLRRQMTKAQGGLVEVGRQLRQRRPLAGIGPVTDPEGFGRHVLGPVVAVFGLRIWLYAAQAAATDRTALLFCARGGVGIREAFERLLARLDLPLPVPRGNLLVSRLVAARAALLAKSPAVLDEIGREFAGATFADVARALGGGSYDLAPDWQQVLDPARLFALMDSDSGREVRADIIRQNDLFRRHLAEVSAGADRIILCDTGLYGSTQRLLAAGIPDLSFETIQFARANYKGHGEEHFPRVAGLVVEQNLYNPLKPETCILRYWQLIESLFEPVAPSVRLFHETPEGGVTANSGDLAFGVFDAAVGNAMLTGALQYIDALPLRCGGARVLGDAPSAWRRLKRAVTRPGADDLRSLGIGPRSVDFGRPDMVADGGGEKDASLLTRLKAVKGQLWREGAVARDFPVLRAPLLTLLETAHAVRALSQLRGR